MNVRNYPFTRGLFMLLTCLTFVSASGCIMIPTWEHGLLAGKGKIDEADISFLKVGITTREDVLLRFGEPDAILNDQQILAYYWKVSVGVIIVYNAAADIPKDCLFMLEFNDDGRLKRAELNASVRGRVEARLNRWALEGEKRSQTIGN